MGNFTGTLVNALSYHLKDLHYSPKERFDQDSFTGLIKILPEFSLLEKTEIALNKLSKTVL